MPVIDEYMKSIAIEQKARSVEREKQVVAREKQRRLAHKQLVIKRQVECDLIEHKSTGRFDGTPYGDALDKLAYDRYQAKCRRERQRQRQRQRQQHMSQCSQHVFCCEHGLPRTSFCSTCRAIYNANR